MPLPKLNNVPLYSMKIPSTGQEIKYRPFLVKEQKVLMIASESEDKKQILSAMLKTISNCVEDDINVGNLATFDVDYMFTQIRAKAVGESAELSLQCSSCEKFTDFKVELNAIEPPSGIDTNIVIDITSDIKVKMKYPSYNTIISNEKINNNDMGNSDFLVEFVLACIESVMTPEENIMMRDEPIEDRNAFIESLTSEQFESLGKFISNIPKLVHEVKVNCEHCSHLNVKSLEGIDDFF